MKVIKKIRYVLYFFLAVCLIIGIQVLFNPLALFNPLRRSPEYQREMMLNITPIGIGMDEAVNILNEARIKNGWVRMEVWRNGRMNLLNLLGSSGYERERLDRTLGLPNEFGEHTIQIILGRYRSGIFYTAVKSHWVFNEYDRLMEVFVTRHFCYASRSVFEGLAN